MMPAPIAPPLPQRPYLPPEPPPGSVICWQQQFTAGGAIYTYAAVHVAWRGWFVTNDNEMPYSWPALFYWLIGLAAVFVAVAWGQL